MKSLKASLVSAFNKLVKHEVIIHRKEVWGCTIQNTYRKLKQKEINEIASMKRMLLAVHGIKSSDLFKIRKREVKAFKKEFDEQLQKQLGLKFYYDAHFCRIQDSDLGMHNYLHSLREKGVLEFAIDLTDEYVFTMTQVYKEKYSERSLELAKEREKNITNTSDSHRVKFLKIMKQYASMWELLLRYFKCTGCIKSSLSVAEPEALETIEQTKKERINQQQSKYSLKEIELEIWEQQGSTIEDRAMVESLKQCNTEEYYEYLAAMEDIRNEIREYEEKRVDKAMEHMSHDADIRELTREVSTESWLAKLKRQWQAEEERERRKWDRIFKEGQPVEWERTTNNPLEHFYRIKYGRSRIG